jgi:hypothetical protein
MGLLSSNVIDTHGRDFINTRLPYTLSSESVFRLVPHLHGGRRLGSSLLNWIKMTPMDSKGQLHSRAALI